MSTYYKVNKHLYFVWLIHITKLIGFHVLLVWHPTLNRSCEIMLDMSKFVWWSGITVTGKQRAGGSSGHTR